ncbi:MAG: NAD-dependent succinate-semialdehyde dehydrogenase [Candidatus Uhrbacteria bacterium]|nr:NAD-dependent succinate-semialdehyde dehydrogenase [Candidatus Uhrbacteria bacterium]
MSLTSTNPTTGNMLKEYPELTDTELDEKLTLAESQFVSWKKTSFEERANLFLTLAGLFKSRGTEIGTLATQEMGKPLAQAIAEVEKCASVCEYYAHHAATILAETSIASDASESYVRFDPTGAVLAVMPWNFPFWQVMRFAAPALMAGNVGLLKHASNVPQCSEALEDLFLEAGFPVGVFQNLLIGSAKVERVIRHNIVQGVALTGSEFAGSKVAALAGSLIKKTVLELGGSDPFIVLEDADIETTAAAAVKARFQNNGQSCIAAKRFIIVDAVYDAFLSAFKTNVEALVIGDPMDLTTAIGPMVNNSSRAEIEKQVADSVALGAVIETGGAYLERPGFYFAPTILSNVKSGMPAYHDELFGPVASVIRVKDAEEAIHVANDTVFGLGSSIWTKNLELAKELAPRIRAGSVFVNGMVKSDVRLPFGGTGISGYGRELSSYGILEFVNIKTVWVK